MLSAIHLLSCTTYNIRMHRPCVGEWALRPILLHMHAKEAHVHAINLLKGKKCFGSVRKGLRHFTRVHKPVVTKTKSNMRGGTTYLDININTKVYITYEGFSYFIWAQ